MQLPITAIAELVIYFLMIVQTLYAAALGYHWFTYGASKGWASVAITVYVIGAIFFLLAMAIAYTTF